MRSDAERTVYLELTGSGVARQDFVVDNTMKTYETIIEVPSDGSYKFMFGFGREPNEEILATPYNIFIDNVKLIKVEEVEEPEEPEEPGEPADGNDGVTEDKNDRSVKTGSWLDFRTLVLVGILLFLIGAGSLALRWVLGLKNSSSKA